MTELAATIVPLLLLASTWLGWRVRKRLSEPHRGRDTVEAVRLVMSMLVTFSALVLGLLTSDAKSRYDAHEAELRRYGIDLIELDQGMRGYGPDAEPARALLRAYTAAAIADTWPGEPHPAGTYPVHLAAIAPGSVESSALGAMLLQVDGDLARLAPSDLLRQRQAALLQDRMAELLRQRWVLVESAQASLQWAFVLVMVFWLALVFALFGLSSPANGLVYAAVGLCALSVSLALYMILDFDTPLTGLMRASSAPLRQALLHMDQAAPAAWGGR